MTSDIEDKDASQLRDMTEVASSVNKAMRTHHVEAILEVLGEVARVQGVSQVSRLAGLRRENLYRSLSWKGNPTLSTLIKILDALGLELRVEVVRKDWRGGTRPIANEKVVNDEKQ